MGNIFLDNGISLANRAWKITGKKACRPVTLRVSLPDEKLTAMVEKTLSELAGRIAFPFGHRLRTRWMQSSRDLSASSSTETAFASMLLRHWDPELSLELLKLYFLNRSIEGKMPVAINPLTVSDFPAYPFVLLALCKYHDITGDTAGTRELFRKYLKFADWLVIYHKAEGGLYLHRDESWFRHDFLVRPLLGADPAAAANWQEVQSAGLNAAITLQYRLLSRAAFSSEETRDGRKLDNHAKKLTTILNETFWNEEKKFYMDRVSGNFAGAPGPSGFLALAAEAPIRSQAAAMIEKLPEVSTDLLTALNTYHKNSVFLYFMIDGLLKYGFNQQAAELAEKFIAAAESHPATQENLFQRIVAVNSLMDHTLGYFNHGSRLVFAPKLPESWKGAPCRIEDNMRGLRIEFMLQDDGNVVYTVVHRGGTLDVTVKNHGFKNVDTGPKPPEAATPAPEPAPAPEKE